jgi:hypothetical protein
LLLTGLPTLLLPRLPALLPRLSTLLLPRLALLIAILFHFRLLVESEV